MTTATYLSVDASGLVDATEAARRLGMTRSAVVYVALSGKLPFTKTATGRMLFDARDVETLRRKRDRR